MLILTEVKEQCDGFNGSVRCEETEIISFIRKEPVNWFVTTGGHAFCPKHVPVATLPPRVIGVNDKDLYPYDARKEPSRFLVHLHRALITKYKDIFDCDK